MCGKGREMLHFFQANACTHDACGCRAVYLRLLDIEVTDELVEAFRHELERYLRSGGITVRWRVGSPVPANTVTIVLHQTEQRLDAKALVRKLDQLAGADDGALRSPRCTTASTAFGPAARARAKVRPHYACSRGAHSLQGG